jgi:aromatic ring-opening dioxygenase catalytic subunit (LigB family)
VITAHWEASTVTVTGGSNPELIYDYYGFPPETYALKYRAPGAPDVAASIVQLLQQADINVHLDPAYGWDHGVFIPLKVMYPTAEIPVVAMSLRAGLDPKAHAAIGRALRPLRDQGVLIVGSGMSYHNLANFDGPKPSADFHHWLDGALNGDAKHREQHLNRWSSAPSGRASHPREEHLMPLMVASAAGSDQPATKIWSGEVGRTAVGAWAFN